MAVICPDEGELWLLNLLLREPLAAAQNWWIDLYTNNIAPAANSVIGDFDLPTFAGYAALALARATWNAPATVGGRAVASLAVNPLVWTSTDPVPVQCFGWVIYEEATVTVLFAEKFINPRTVEIGNPLALDLALALRSEN